MYVLVRDVPCLLGFLHQLVVQIVPDDTPSGHIACFVILLAKLILHDSIVAGRVNELVIAEVDADMRDAFAIRVEEYEVSGSKIALVDRIALLCLRFGLMGQLDADFVKYIHRETGAVESACGRSCCFVLGADQLVDGLVQYRVRESGANLRT